MTLLLIVRIILDFTAVGLLFVGLAYWWLGNTVHEVVGTAMFVLLVSHNVFNRRWWANLPTRFRERKGSLALASNGSLLLAMVALLVTSMLICHTLLGAIPFRGGRIAREIHILAAYWALIIAAIHLCLHWSMIMAVIRNRLRLGPPTFLRTICLRIVVATIGACGLYSSSLMGIGSRLIARPSIEFWDFEQSVFGFSSIRQRSWASTPSSPIMGVSLSCGSTDPRLRLHCRFPQSIQDDREGWRELAATGVVNMISGE